MSEPLPKLAFFGTPEFAVRVLRPLCESGAYDIAAVVTETDKPAGRGQQMQASAVKQFALENNIPVLQPERLRKIRLDESGSIPRLTADAPEAEELLAFLNQSAPYDVFIIVAYGKIIPRALLRFPRCGMVNVHASLLPRWRGAAPIHQALFSGDQETGISIMQTEYELDAGPVFLERKCEITQQDTFGSLHDRLAALGAEALLEALPGILDGSLKAQPQSENGITYAEKWQKEDCSINWEEPAEVSLRRIRTCAPFPGARTSLNGQLLKIFAAHLHPNQSYPPSSPGTIVEINRAELVVAAGPTQYIAIDELQLAGRKRLPVAEVLRGAPLQKGDILRS